RYGIPHTGLFRTADEDRFIILDVKGIKVGLLSYSELYNGKEGCVSGCPYMINTYSASAIKRDVAAAKAAGAELIVAYNHWGTEHVHKPTDDVRRHAKQMADAGVDIICGSHSHSMQPIVWLTASDGRRVLCMYSLGNFVSSMARETANDTVIVEVRITRESSGRVLVANEICHPCRVFPQLQGKYFVVVPTDNTSIPSIKSRLKEAEKRIMDIITSEQG
ncbi:MAG: CapA family protein, partial [Clostridia bacterium]|nr:CapA family protein [Clostridia bacterium]